MRFRQLCAPSARATIDAMGKGSGGVVKGGDGEGGEGGARKVSGRSHGRTPWSENHLFLTMAPDREPRQVVGRSHGRTLYLLHSPFIAQVRQRKFCSKRSCQFPISATSVWRFGRPVECTFLWFEIHFV